MGYQTVRALITVKHNGVDRVPGVVSGPNSQDFVVNDALATPLVSQGVVDSLGAADEPRMLVPLEMEVGIDTKGDASLPEAASSAVAGALATIISLSAFRIRALTDRLDNARVYRVLTGLYTFTWIAGGYFLDISNGDNIDVAFAEWTAAVRPIVEARQGRVHPVTVGAGRYPMSGPNKTMTLESWMSKKAMGAVKIDASAAAQPVYWFRNDVTPLFSMGNDSATNTTPIMTAETNYAPHDVLDGSNGPFIINGTRTPGSVGLRYGNGDGYWGTAFATNLVNISMMCGVKGLHVMFMEEAFQLTNNNCFSSRWDNIWASNCDHTIGTSAAPGDVNSYEQHSFLNFFSGNCYKDHVIKRSTGLRDHQLSFGHFSFTQCPGAVVRLTTSAESRDEFIQGRWENNLNCVVAEVDSPRSWVTGANVTIIPTNTYNGLTTHLRTMFRGEFILQMANTRFDLTGSPAWGTKAYGQASNQFLCDEKVRVQATNTQVIDPPGSNATGNAMRNQAFWSPNSNRIYNGSFHDGTSRWTFGGSSPVVPSITTTVGEYVDGAAGLKIVFANQNLEATSAKFAVDPGSIYYADLCARVDPGFTTSTIFIPMTIVWYSADGDVIPGVAPTPASQNASNNNWFNRRLAAGFDRHNFGTGKLTAPAGASYGAVRFKVGSSVDGSGTLVGTMFIDRVVCDKT